jgi:hypothetical protein
MTPKELFNQAYGLIKNEKRWTQKQNARNVDGYRVSVDDSTAVCWCSNGAILRYVSGNGDYRIVRRALAQTAKEEYFHQYNDTHTHAEVMAMWEETGKREGWL